MLQVDPSKRLSAKELLNNPAFNAIRIAKLENDSPEEIDLKVDEMCKGEHDYR